ncbi:DUF4998 domain-containing protein [Niabella drilacis]|uniref:DUF4998 domain-containing protein n=1 Tax=Niabella drilacis (strain DSM 25811 / CCM 8410 / CCUG 62505 / LMG 26954 / E90) TaxID=1285928 RepID=A0A1G7BLL2_NIADE|nr:DUF4998 domain-containing protein [Niabella drilacis]SDE27165.1 protein of unknown function [Niabella drilacis]
MKYIFGFLLAVTGCMLSCSKMEDMHRKYLQDGELHYVGAPYDVGITPLVKGVRIRFAKTADPTVLKYIIYWNNRDNSQDVNPTDSPVESVDLEGLASGNYSFELIAVDGAGNRSKTVYAAGVVE